MTAPLQNLISVDDLTREHLDSFFDRANYYLDHYGQEKWNDLEGKILLSVFCEPSTRTRFSFEAAMIRRGGQVINAQDAKTSSSFAKDESLADGSRVISSNGDIMVLRHPDPKAMEIAVETCQVPLINGGNGSREHPSQTCVDLFTFQHEFGCIDGLTIAMAGDLCFGRTVHSLAKALAMFYKNIRMIFISPETISLGREIKADLNNLGANYCEYASLAEAPLAELNVLYMTRIQKERFGDERDYEAVRGCCVLRPELVKQMRKDAIVTHPLPRVDELPKVIDKDERARYFEQADYGKFVRMEILRHMLLGW